MHPPIWQPPGKPAPFAPAARTAAIAPEHPSTGVARAVAAVGPALLLRAPLWAPQADESPPEHSAFLAWLMGGFEFARSRGAKSDAEARLVVRGDWAAALGVLACTSAQVHALAHKWSWEVRGREYWTHMREINETAARVHEESVLEYAALARELDREWLALQILEVRKARAIAERKTPEQGHENDPEFLPRLFDNREMIQAYRATGGLEVQRFRAGVLERAKVDESTPQTDWGKLPPADLEAYRVLRDKAKASS